MPPKSPITGSNNVVLDKKIPTSLIINSYKKGLNVDVKRFFHSVDEINVYKCLDTDYRFYHPFDITGDDSFYQELERFPWYYMDSKWEHEVASDFINKND